MGYKQAKQEKPHHVGYPCPREDMVPDIAEKKRYPDKDDKDACVNHILLLSLKVIIPF
jgi:hypothetical protein